MTLKLFYDQKWFAFEAPKKPDYGDDVAKTIKNYNKAYAKAKRNAWPVINPEVAVFQPKGLNSDTKHFYFHSHLGLKYFEVKDDEDYDWPGEWEVKEVDTVEDVGGCYVAGSREVIVLSPPNQPVKMKTEEDVLKEKYANDWEEEGQSIPYDRDYDHEIIVQAMQEYSDQQLAAFKEKLKLRIDEEVRSYNVNKRLSAVYIKQLIDQL